ncbi:hypothetical protein H7I41_28460 [Mycobacterium manitobense]|jgi:hypothetical protein|uniref:Uncharacterized protein n=1 Tax=[Mycobacterium] manitobense TaxID=190147 RepID=A0A9X2YX49_9MYCO|nr:hypothetical protein [[Mycobacterium] manitobense]MCV7173862.1 hypothetical protein [[Mycobacterium] manitobense]
MFSRTTSLLALVLGAAGTGVIIATAPTAAACDPGWYPTDTAGVCTDMPPAMRPAPAPLHPIAREGQNAIINDMFETTPADSDGDGWIDSLDKMPFDRAWR